MKPASRSLLVIAIAGLAVVVYFVGIRPRVYASAALDERARAVGHPSVNVVIARHSPNANEILLPASLQAFQEAPIYARTTGYLNRFMVDIGDHVTAGQTLAIIDGPEVDQELNQARAALEQARANLELARSSAVRWKGLGAQNAVSQQEVDEKQAAFAAREADTHAAEANVSRLIQLKQYQTIVAPFEGVVSARNVDVGSLVSSGSGGRELFRIAQTDPLRIYASIPQAYSRSIHPGLEVALFVNEFPSRTFNGKVVRVAGALDPASRTLLTEVQIPNDQNELLAGMFGQVRFRLQAGEPPLIIPSNAILLRNDGTYVAVVDAAHAIHLTKVKIGRDFGLQVEVVAGLKEGTQVVGNPSDALADGLVVEPILPAPATKG